MCRYERGEYPQAVIALEMAVEEIGPELVLGGEAQLWLALSYEVRDLWVQVRISCHVSRVKPIDPWWASRSYPYLSAVPEFGSSY